MRPPETFCVMSHTCIRSSSRSISSRLGRCQTAENSGEAPCANLSNDATPGGGSSREELARLGLLRRVQQTKDGASYVVVDPAGIRRALIEHGLDPFLKLPGDFFNHVAKIDKAAAA